MNVLKQALLCVNKNLWPRFNKTLTGDIPCCNPVSVEHIQVANPQFSPLPVVPVGTGVSGEVCRPLEVHRSYGHVP